MIGSQPPIGRFLQWIQNISGSSQGLTPAGVIEWDDADRPSGETHAARSAQSSSFH
jgi:hypothetical protein